MDVQWLEIASGDAPALGLRHSAWFSPVAAVEQMNQGPVRIPVWPFIGEHDVEAGAKEAATVITTTAEPL